MRTCALQIRWQEILGRQSPFLKSVFTLSAGTMMAQMLGVFVMPIISRVYNPADFGLLGTFSAVATVVGMTCTLKYEWAQVTAANEEDASLLHALGWILSLVTAALSLAGIMAWELWGCPLPGLYGLLPVTVLLVALTSVETFRLNRGAYYRRLSLSRVASSLAGAPVRIGLGLMQCGAMGLGLADVLAQTVGLGLIGKRPKPAHIGDLRRVAGAYRRFALFSAPAALLNTISYQFEYLLFAVWFTLPQIGAYFLWNRVIAIPKQILASSIWQVFLKDTALLQRSEILERKTHRQAHLIALTALPYYSGALLLPSFMGLFFGCQWEAYVDLITPILIGGHVNLVVSSFSVFVILNENRAELVFNALLSVSKILAVCLLATYVGNFTVTVWAIGIAQALLFWGLGEWNYRMLGSRPGMFSWLYWRYGIWPSILPLLVLVLAMRCTSSLVILALLCLILNGIHLWRNGGLRSFCELRQEVLSE
ncbi:MAG: oligosaccharide flippase family protein [Lentisphaerota bacterium]